MWYRNNSQDEDICSEYGLQIKAHKATPPIFGKGVKDIIEKRQTLQQMILEKMAYPSAEE